VSLGILVLFGEYTTAPHNATPSAQRIFGGQGSCHESGGRGQGAGLDAYSHI
jgi:hypothetical protein